MKGKWNGMKVKNNSKNNKKSWKVKTKRKKISPFFFCSIFFFFCSPNFFFAHQKILRCQRNKLNEATWNLCKITSHWFLFDLQNNTDNNNPINKINFWVVLFSHSSRTTLEFETLNWISKSTSISKVEKVETEQKKLIERQLTIISKAI